MLTMTFRPVGRGEIARMLGVGRTRADFFTAQPDFPPPAAELLLGPIWNLEDVQRWADDRTPRRDLDLTVIADVPALDYVPGRLIGRREIELMDGRSRTMVNRVLNREDFPAPVARLGLGAIWSMAAVQEWAASAGRALNVDALEKKQ